MYVCVYYTCMCVVCTAPSGTDSDSGVNLLESPCVVDVTWTTPAIDVLHQLHRLEPLPLSPDWNMYVRIYLLLSIVPCMWVFNSHSDFLLSNSLLQDNDHNVQ